MIIVNKKFVQCHQTFSRLILKVNLILRNFGSNCISETRHFRDSRIGIKGPILKFLLHDMILKLMKNIIHTLTR